MSFQDISIKDFKRDLKHKALIIDIRDEESYHRGNISGSVNYNSEDIIKLIEESVKKEQRNKNIVICCYHGNSSRKVASFLSENGFNNIYSLIGGFSAWQNS
ncbi:MAG: thiosulfate sulfurtransferase [Candidatus Marinimicrobia bacterium]|nr:thiosulfate sulfurtransferase [Candidatus Neomarinimicrobiota bacterium]|tara:strand:+ start:518 stop:823 length:306 start_codon:yes stop_codon:yes gene_type:complete